MMKLNVSITNFLKNGATLQDNILVKTVVTEISTFSLDLCTGTSICAWGGRIG